MAPFAATLGAKAESVDTVADDEAPIERRDADSVVPVSASKMLSAVPVPEFVNRNVIGIAWLGRNEPSAVHVPPAHELPVIALSVGERYVAAHVPTPSQLAA